MFGISDTETLKDNAINIIHVVMSSTKIVAEFLSALKQMLHIYISALITLLMFKR